MTSTPFADLLRAARADKGWTLDELARLLSSLEDGHVSFQAVAAYEHGRRRPTTAARVRNLARILGLDPDTAVRLWSSPSVPTQPRPTTEAGTPPAVVGADLTPSEQE